MKHIFKIAIFIFAFAAIVSSLIYSQLIQAKMADPGLSKNNISTIQIELKNPIALDALVAEGNNASFDEMILESNFTVNNEAVHDFYVVDGKNKNKNIKEDYIKNRKAFLADLKGVEQMPVNSANIENIAITKITVTGGNSDIEQLKKGLVIDKISVKPDTASQTRGKSKPDEAHLLNDGNVSAATLSITPMYLSLPTSGTSYFYPSSYGGRYTQQNMTWSAINFASDQTYEQKVIVYNYDRKTYLDGTSTSYPGCYPNATYAATSWPEASKPYLDTRFSENLISCEIDELSYTIGAAQANALQPNTNYYTYIRTANGNDMSDKFKLQGQVGYRSPSSCYSTWCSAKYKIYNIILAWSTAVPGTQSWIYNGQAPEAPSDVSVSVSNATASSLQVNFTDNTYDETNIWIERKKVADGYWVSLGTFGALPGAYDYLIPGSGKWYWINNSLSSKTVYCYRLKATNNVGSSAYSNEGCGITL